MESHTLLEQVRFNTNRLFPFLLIISSIDINAFFVLFATFQLSHTFSGWCSRDDFGERALHTLWLGSSSTYTGLASQRSSRNVRCKDPFTKTLLTAESMLHISLQKLHPLPLQAIFESTELYLRRIRSASVMSSVNTAAWWSHCNHSWATLVGKNSRNRKCLFLLKTL